MCGHMWSTQPEIFSVEKARSDVFAPVSGWGETIAPVSPWTTQQQAKPSYADDEALKKQFGIELAKNENNAFKAACIVFEKDTSAALWIASNWLVDPVVVAAKDVYLKTVKTEASLLDKDAFAGMLLDFATAKNEIVNGRIVVVEAKDRLAALKLYAEVQGFIGKNEATIQNNFSNNELKVVFVKTDPAPTKPILVPNPKSEILNDENALPELKIKLVR